MPRVKLRKGRRFAPLFFMSDLKVRPPKAARTRLWPKPRRAFLRAWRVCAATAFRNFRG